LKNFHNKIKNIRLANSQQRKTELWDVEGILHNQKFKFDTRPIYNNIKIGSFKSKADKIVLDIEDEYIIIDTEELHQYIKKNQNYDLNLNDLISTLEWTIRLPKEAE